MRRHLIPSFREYLTVKEAAELLGVSPETRHNWDRAGELKRARHPTNGYRLYKREVLEALSNQAAGVLGGRRRND
jgi:excisionase family DNA binding protein